MAAPTNADPGSLEEQALTALLDVIRAGSTPEAVQAQALMLRRLALQGDVVGSRVPAPRNISEIGGYINLLTDLGEPDVRTQMLASLLGVSGPNVPLSGFSGQPALSWVVMPNDRPQGTAQPSIPLSISVRSDFAPALQAALKTLHDQGCTLPLLSQARALPMAVPGAPPLDDPLPYIGRALDVVPTAALVDPDVDPVAAGSSSLRDRRARAERRRSASGRRPLGGAQVRRHDVHAGACAGGRTAVRPGGAGARVGGFLPGVPSAAARIESRPRMGPPDQRHGLGSWGDAPRRRARPALLPGRHRRFLTRHPTILGLERHQVRAVVT